MQTIVRMLTAPFFSLLPPSHRLEQFTRTGTLRRFGSKDGGSLSMNASMTDTESLMGDDTSPTKEPVRRVTLELKEAKCTHQPCLDQ